jgi:hypothetical protein
MTPSFSPQTRRYYEAEGQAGPRSVLRERTASAAAGLLPRGPERAAGRVEHPPRMTGVRFCRRSSARRARPGHLALAVRLRTFVPPWSATKIDWHDLLACHLRQDDGIVVVEVGKVELWRGWSPVVAGSAGGDS